MTRSLCMFSEEDRQFLTIQVGRLKFIHKINKNKMDSFPSYPNRDIKCGSISVGFPIYPPRYRPKKGDREAVR